MDALVPLFVAVLIAELGGKAQMLAHMHGLERRSALGLSSLFLASLGSFGFAAAAGWLLAPQLPLEARHLLFAVALLFSGLHMLVSAPAVPTLQGQPALGASLWQFGRVMLGGDAAFLVFGMAAKSGTPILAALSGLVAIMVAGLAPIALGRDWPVKPLRVIRRALGLLLAGAGFYLGISTMWLVGAG